jgi:Protein of unknown function (DUF2795)
VKVSPIEVEKYLKGEDYPAKKEELVRHAQEQGAPSEVLQALKKLPEQKMFQKPTDVVKAISEMK